MEKYHEKCPRCEANEETALFARLILETGKNGALLANIYSVSD